MEIRSFRPGRCRLWNLHSRLGESVNVSTCDALISSIEIHGQKQPVLGRLCSANHDGYDVELIYGARRLFAAQQLGIELLVEIRELDDRSALIEMDIENRVRSDISPYERGLSYHSWMRSGFFKSQAEMARALGVSASQISRLMNYAELPVAIIEAFDSSRDIREEWAVAMAKRVKNPEHRESILRRARNCSGSGERRAPQAIFNALISDRLGGSGRLRSCDEVIRSAGGRPLFRVALRAKSVHLVLPRHDLPRALLQRITTSMQSVMQDWQEEQTATHRADRPTANGKPAVLDGTSLSGTL